MYSSFGVSTASRKKALYSPDATRPCRYLLLQCEQSYCTTGFLPLGYQNKNPENKEQQQDKSQAPVHFLNRRNVRLFLQLPNPVAHEDGAQHNADDQSVAQQVDLIHQYHITNIRQG